MKKEKRFYKAIPDGFSDWENVKIIVATDDEIIIHYNNGSPSVLKKPDPFFLNYEIRRQNSKCMTRIPEAEAALIL
jgi:hypothetical protein